MFRLLHSAASARAALERAGEGAAKMYIQVAARGRADRRRGGPARRAGGKLTGSGKRPLKADLKRAKGQAARERAQEPRGRSRRAAGCTKRAPLPDEERSPVVDGDRGGACGGDAADRVPERHGRCRPGHAAAQRAAALLTSETAAGGVHADMFAPRAGQPADLAHTIESMREVIERRIRYLQDDGDAARRGRSPCPTRFSARC